MANISRRAVLGAYGGALVAGVLTTKARASDETEGKNDETEEVLDKAAVADRSADWSLLTNFHEERVINKINLQFFDRGYSDNLPKTVPAIRKDIEIADRRLLRIVEEGLRRGDAVRLVLHEKSRGAYGGGANLGVLTFETSQDTFKVLVSQVGFALDSKSAELHRMFYSPTLAYLLADQYRRLAEAELPAPLIDALSGAASLESFRKYILKALADAKVPN